MYGYSIRQKAVVKKMMKFPFKDTILLHMKFLNSDMRGAACREDTMVLAKKFLGTAIDLKSFGGRGHGLLFGS